MPLTFNFWCLLIFFSENFLLLIEFPWWLVIMNTFFMCLLTIWISSWELSVQALPIFEWGQLSHQLLSCGGFWYMCCLAVWLFPPPRCYWWYFIFIADNRTIWKRLNLFCTIRNCVMLLPCIGELFGVWTCFLCVGPVEDRERVFLSTSAPDTVSEVSTGACWAPASRQLGTRLAVSSLTGWWEPEAKLCQMPSGGA